MQRNKPKWRADRGARALKILGEIEASIAALGDDDLLDLADIFKETSTSTLGMMSSGEVARRKIM